MSSGYYFKCMRLSPWRFCVALFILSRVLLFLQLNWLNQIFMLRLSPSQWLMQFDALLYAGIVKNGYLIWSGIGPPADVFFPLLPMLVAAVHIVFFIPIDVAGILVANLFFLASLYLFFCLIVHYFKDELLGRFGVALLALTPFNIYFASFYTESLFLFLSLLIWLMALDRKWMWVGILGLLLSALRPTGILMIVPVLYIIVRDYRIDKKPFSHCWPILLMPFGLFAFMLYLKIHTGHALNFMTEQSYWYRGGWYWHGFFAKLLHDLANRYNAFFLIMSLYFTYRLYRWNYVPEAIYLLIMLMPGPLSGVFDSIARYSACLFAFYFTIVCFCQNRKDRMLLVLGIELVYMGIYLAEWIQQKDMFM